MLLELGKIISVIASILMLYQALASAFFVPAMHWEDRLFLTVLKLCLAGCVCLAGGLIFAWPGRSGSPLPLHSTLPVQIFLWAIVVISLEFAVSWYVSCGNPLRGVVNVTCGR
jgi:hypothetical protein